MSLLPVPLEVTSISLSGVNLTFVAAVGVIAVIALVMAMIFRREVLAANDGAPEYAVNRTRRTGRRECISRPPVPHLGVFAVAAFFLLLLLPVHTSTDFSA